jgi:anthranilate phosphoribosyltransferase
MGVPQPALTETLARVLQLIGLRRAMVVSGKAGNAWLDELSPLGDSTIAEFYQDRGFSSSTLSPSHLPIRPAALADLAGGDKKENAAIIRKIFENQDRGPRRDAILLNAGAALFVAGKARTILDGWELAAAVIDDGRAKAKLAQLASG